MKNGACLVIVACLVSGCVTDAVDQCVDHAFVNPEGLKTQEDVDMWREMRRANDESLFEVDTSWAGPTECGG